MMLPPCIAAAVYAVRGTGLPHAEIPFDLLRFGADSQHFTVAFLRLIGGTLLFAPLRHVVVKAIPLQVDRLAARDPRMAAAANAAPSLAMARIHLAAGLAGARAFDSPLKKMGPKFRKISHFRPAQLPRGNCLASVSR